MVVGFDSLVRVFVIKGVKASTIAGRAPVQKCCKGTSLMQHVVFGSFVSRRSRMIFVAT